MPHNYFECEGGEVEAMGFVSNIQWLEVKSELAAHDVDFNVFCGEQGPVQMVRRLAPYVASRQGGDRVLRAWQRSTDRLYDLERQTKQKMGQTKFRYSHFGVAIPNSRYIEREIGPSGDNIARIGSGFNRWDDYSQLIRLSRDDLMTSAQSGSRIVVAFCYQDRD